MSATAEAPIEPGLPVEIGRIDKELGKLWETVGDTKTRASLINLAIYTENAKAVAENTSLIRNCDSTRLSRASHLRKSRRQRAKRQGVDQRTLPPRRKG